MPQAIETSTVTFNNGQTTGYLARPSDASKHPSIIILQEWWGINDDIKDIAERYARQGFAALAPDIYHGKVFTVADEARQASGGLDQAKAAQDIDAAAAWLTQQSFASGPQFGCVGFCMGGGLALRTASRNPNVSACISYYGGIRDAVDETVAKIKAPVLAFHGSDEAERAGQLKAAFEKQSKPFELHIYEGARHGFFNRQNVAVHHMAASYDTWPRALEFFRRNVK